MPLTIHSKENDTPYEPLIKTFFSIEFPVISSKDTSTILEAVSAAVLATGQVRYGPRPSPESLVALREVMRVAISEGRPIPMLTPWGSRKAKLGAKLDVAEIFALKQLACLQRRVTEVYSPGVQVNIRLEDASGPYVFITEGEASKLEEAEYCNSFAAAVKVLELNAFIKPVLESTLFTTEQLFEKADQMLEPMLRYIQLSDLYGIEDNLRSAAWKELISLGWDNTIPKEQRDYYRGRYKALYPGLSDQDATIKLARYFSQAWARAKLNGRGDDPSWKGSYIRTTFIPPVPGSMPQQNLRDVYYRTLPTRYTEYHAMPWRTKGYLTITEENEIIPKLASWYEVRDYHDNEIVFDNGSSSVVVKADYVLV